MNKHLQTLHLCAVIVGVTLIASCGGTGDNGGQTALSVNSESLATKGCEAFALTPIVSVTPTMISGIDGYINPALGSHVDVSVQQGGTVIRSTRPNAKGAFFLNDLAPGHYDVVFTAQNFATAVIADVPIATPTSIVSVSTTSAPIDLQPAITVSHSISGSITLTPVSKTEAGYTTVQQSFSSGRTITLSCQRADMLSGAYKIADLPTVAPQLGQYKPELPIVFVTQNITVPGTGRYRVEASANGYKSQTNPSVDVRSADQFGINFALLGA